MIYAVGPDCDGDRIAAMRPGPAWLRSALAAIAILAVGCGSGVMVVGLVLGPNISTGAAEEALRAPFLAQIGQKLDQHGAEPTAILTQPPSARRQRPSREGPRAGPRARRRIGRTLS